MISGTFVGVLPCISIRWPSRSGASLVLLCTVESAFSTPETTRNIVMRPANGSAIVFQTNADSGALLVGGARDRGAGLVEPVNGRSAGDGR